MKKFILIFCWINLLISCKNNSEAVEFPVEFNAESLIEILKKPDSIPKEKLAEIAGTESSKIKIYNEWFSPDVSKRNVLFSWPNGGFKTVKNQSGKELKLDAYNSLGFGFIKEISKDEFQQKFDSKAFLQNEIDRITKDENIPTDLAIADAKNLAQNAKIQNFEKLENIGEVAYWETPVNALHVFTNGISFTITTNFSDEKQSQIKAIKFLNLILN